MNLVEYISDKIESVKKSNGEPLEAYDFLWQNIFDLSTDDYDSLVLKIKDISPVNIQTEGLLQLCECLKAVFNPKFGDPFHMAWEAYYLFEKCDFKYGMGVAQVTIAMQYRNSGLLFEALETLHKSNENLSYYPKTSYFLGACYFQEGEIHKALKDYEKATQVFENALEVLKNANHSMPARLCCSIGCLYIDTNQLEKAEKYLFRSLKLLNGIASAMVESKIYSDIGRLYLKKKDFTNSLLYQQKSIAIRLKFNQEHPLITSYLEMSELHLMQDQFPEALEYALKAEKLTIDLKVKIRLFETHLMLSKVYEKLGDKTLALEFFKKYHENKETVLSAENARGIKQLTTNFEIAQIQKEKEIFELKNVVLKAAMEEIESSIRYAKRLQEAILPSKLFLDKYLPENFVYYAPKDIVAGDFYYAEKVDDNFFIAAADSTGHGVPGAIVSVVCSNALHRAIKEFKLTETGKILDKSRELVIETFEKSPSEVKDGMDISLLCINLKNNNISWSGANNPLWYVQEKELKEIKADKQPIGKTDYPKPFTTHRIEYKENITFYLFTDGFADQFGGPNGKKFKYKQFSDLLIKNNSLPQKQQAANINKAFSDWKGDLDQVDDVCVIGIKL